MSELPIYHESRADALRTGDFDMQKALLRLILFTRSEDVTLLSSQCSEAFIRRLAKYASVPTYVGKEGTAFTSISAAVSEMWIQTNMQWREQLGKV
jgi:hypothetical protein